jgi:LuxR family maltose regulon positive regulatory protein
MTTKAVHRLDAGKGNKIPISLLKTKLYAPSPPPRMVRRPRLVARLNDGLQCKLTLISAPAGFGKTVLLSEWIANIDQPVAWLSLDDNDNDPALFGAYLIAALQTKEANFGKAAMAALHSPSYAPPIGSILTAVINELYEKDIEVALVFDDYHEIANQVIHNAVSFLIDHMPPKMRLVITGRAEPPFCLARLRTLGQLTELHAADMRFTIDETTVLLNDVMNLELSQEDVKNLVARTEGWAAGLVMAALAMRDREDIANFITNFSGSHHYIVDYLTEEVIQRQKEDVQSFLLKTAILERMTGPLCGTLTERDDGQEMLEYLEAANLFVVPLDDERLWYRYHPLFADVLRNQLSRLSPSLVPVLHRRASEWFEQEGLMDEAVHHTLATADFERAAGLIETMSQDLLMQGRITTLLGLLEQLPPEVIARRQRLCVHCAWAYLMAGQKHNIEPLLQTAESGLTTLPRTNTKVVKGHMLGIRGYMAKWQGDIPNTIEISEEALKVFPEDEPGFRPVVLGNIGHAYFEKGDMANAWKYMEDSNKSGQAGGNSFAKLASMGFLAYILIEQGQLQEAAKVCRRTIQMGMELGGWHPLPATSFAYIGLGQVLYEWNYLKGAMEQLNRGIELGEAGQFWVAVLRGYLTLAQLHQAMGDTDAAMQAAAKAEKTASKIIMARESCNISIWKARLALAQGDLSAAVHWANSQDNKLNLSNVPDYRLEPRYLTLVWIKVAQGEAKEISGSLERLRQKVEAEGRIKSVIEILALQALAFATLGETERATATLEKALVLAEPESYSRLFLDYGPPMRQLLQQSATHVCVHRYVAELLKAFKIARSDKVLPTNQTKTPLLDILNEREMAILRLKGTHSDREIANQLYLSVNTVKWYAHRIYSKLGVSNRAEAISLAHELNIL